jgi:hypothetical protein
MVAHCFMLNKISLLGFSESNELDRYDSALMQKLEEAVLSVCPWLSKVDDCSFVLDLLALGVDSFPVTLHV